MRVLYILVVLIATGCTRYRQADDGHVSALIEARIDQQVAWRQECREQINCRIQSLLEKPLTPEAAIQIAFLKNPQVQATFEELGIAHADLVEAGLLSNPNFSVEVRYPTQHCFVTNIEYLVTTAFLDIFLVPLRTRVAAVAFEQAKRRVAHEILDLAFQVSQVYYELVAGHQKLAYTKSIVEIISISNELMSRQYKVGNVNDLGLQQLHARYLEAQMDIAKEQSSLTRLREKLNRLLGLDEDLCLILPEIPEQFDDHGFDLCTLESIALSERLDLQEARFEVMRLGRMLGLKAGWTYTDLQAGLAGERDSDRSNLVGFGVGGQLPIFNYGQAARMRIRAELRQAEDHYAALEIQVLSEVREAHQLLMLNLGMLHEYRSEIIPLQQKIASSSEEFYNVMGLGVDGLLENKRQELAAHRNYLEILKDYWVSKVALDRALGGYLFRLCSIE